MLMSFKSQTLILTLLKSHRASLDEENSSYVERKAVENAIEEAFSLNVFIPNSDITEVVE